MILIQNFHTSNKIKSLFIERKISKIKTFDLNCFHGKNHFGEDGTQNWFVFQTLGTYLKVTYANDNNYISSWQSKGLSDLEINSIKRNNYLLNPYIEHHDTSKIRIKFNRSFLNRFPPTILHGKIVNIYIVYEITNNFNASSYLTLENCLFGSVKLTKNTDINKYRYSGYGTGFDRKGFFSHPRGGTGRNVTIFGEDMNSSTKIDNKGKDILIVGMGTIQGLGEHSLSAEKMY